MNLCFIVDFTQKTYIRFFIEKLDVKDKHKDKLLVPDAKTAEILRTSEWEYRVEDIDEFFGIRVPPMEPQHVRTPTYPTHWSYFDDVIWIAYDKRWCYGTRTLDVTYERIRWIDHERGRDL